MQTRLLLPSSGTIDLYDDVAVSCTYSIADIREPDKRSTGFSKTITIPGTKNNNKLFGQLFEIGIADSFNPNLKASAVLTIDHMTQLKGHLQLLKVKRIDTDKVEYDVAIVGKLANLFSEINDAKLSNLDLSEFDHAYTRTNQSDSWATQIQKNGSNYAFALGEGYVYPLIDYGFDSQHAVWKVESMFPAVYVKQFWDKIFEYAGFTYSSTFLTSTFFKRLIIPFAGESLKLTDAQIIARQFYAVNNSLQEEQTDPYSNLHTLLGQAVVASFQNDSTPPGTDPSGIYNNSTYKFTPNFLGTYKIDATIKSTYRLDPPVGAVSYRNYFGFFVAIVKTSGGVDTVLNSVSWQPNNGSIVTTAIPGGNITTNVDVSITWTGLLNTSDDITIRVWPFGFVIWVDSNGFNLPGNISTTGPDDNIYLRVNTGSTFNNSVVNKVINEGSTLNMNDVLPQDILMKDFIKSIINMFNLYIEPDQDVENKLNIEPRNDFYSSSTPLDWTRKQDLSKPLEIIPMGALEAKRYIFSYKPDDDYYNKKYSDRWDSVFGERIWEVDNDFIKSDKKTELIFAPTPSVNFKNSDRVTPAIYAQDDNGVLSQKQAKIRILYYAGLISCAPAWIHRSMVPTQTDIQHTTYPYCGMVDSPTAPTLDLCFGVPKEIYWKTSQYTNNHLFNKYYKRFIEEITDKDSKIVVMYLYLTIADINQLNFARLVYIDGITYRINKIIDFNPIKYQTTKVELIKVKDQLSFTSRNVVLTGGIKTEIDTAESA